jgi:hypothetical protein
MARWTASHDRRMSPRHIELIATVGSILGCRILITPSIFFTIVVVQFRMCFFYCRRSSASNKPSVFTLAPTCRRRTWIRAALSPAAAMTVSKPLPFHLLPLLCLRPHARFLRLATLPPSHMENLPNLSRAMPPPSTCLASFPAASVNVDAWRGPAMRACPCARRATSAGVPPLS